MTLTSLSGGILFLGLFYQFLSIVICYNFQFK